VSVLEGSSPHQKLAGTGPLFSQQGLFVCQHVRLKTGTEIRPRQGSFPFQTANGNFFNITLSWHAAIVHTLDSVKGMGVLAWNGDPRGGGRPTPHLLACDIKREDCTPSKR
jgi:hypothetical protein